MVYQIISIKDIALLVRCTCYLTTNMCEIYVASKYVSLCPHLCLHSTSYRLQCCLGRFFSLHPLVRTNVVLYNHLHLFQCTLCVAAQR